MQAILALEDGRIFRGKGYGAKAECYGEVVFNTALTGYQEVFTDPSYSGQIVILTNPQIGNYGTSTADNESKGPYIEGLVVREFSPKASNWRSDAAADTFLTRAGVPIVSDLDTRPRPPPAHPRCHARCALLARTRWAEAGREGAPHSHHERPRSRQPRQHPGI